MPVRLQSEYQTLNSRVDQLSRLTQSINNELTIAGAKLGQQETLVQLASFERRWQQAEQVNAALRDWLAARRAEMDTDGRLANKALRLAEQCNVEIKAGLSGKNVL
ncbi:unnamed protein product [Protopolystoma xenopodis]|uniref:Uncharacterized protein n=1 Tax=Protopolystoma xenopodis TaxID=117903 RepID=A0A448XRD0_9PLAT|nr:unnamed protein product [Protopolystoma xenopodis]